ncbi:MAG: membrane protein insertion efficiency factor YidD [Zhaonellaceae bacterium]|jgi:putative membrane protein insertion efficiency factor|nr:membrane protein insertion efficiency factor YidD [Clostridia bacterium]
MVRILIWLIRLYQKYVSPLFPRSCKFSPTCSQYSIEVLQKYGFLKGMIKALWRILRCNPFSAGGYDPS